MALRHPWDRTTAASTLARIAAADRRAVERALARVRRALDERPSPVGERAAEALDAVLAAMRTG